MALPMRLNSIAGKRMPRNRWFWEVRRIAVLAVALACGGCMAFRASKRTYAGHGGAEINGARVVLQVKPEGSAGGSFAFSAMVVGAGTATLDGPFSWRIVATGRAGEHEEMVVHRLHTRTSKTKRSEWFPARQLGRVARFRKVREQPGVVRARYEIPGHIEIKPREDGAITVKVDVSVKANGHWKRSMVEFHLDPDEKTQNEVIFLPAEIVESIGADPEDWDDPMWDE